MEFFVAFYEPGVLADAGSRGLAGHFPHLRLVSLLPREQTEALLDALPPYLRHRVIHEPPAEFLDSGKIEAILTADPVRASEVFPDVGQEDILIWDELGCAYDRWLDSHYLPLNSVLGMHTPQGLFPPGWQPARTTLEIIGSCNSEFLERAVPQAAEHFPGEVTSFHTVKNHPVDGGASADGEQPTHRVVMPPLRFMHPQGLDDFVFHPDPEQLFGETRQHLFAYLDSVAEANPAVPLFVIGFLEPYMDPSGISFARRDLANPKYFVRSLNDAIVKWCEGAAVRHFVDGDEIAAGIGKSGVDDGTLSFLAHRGVMIAPEWEDGLDAAHPTVALSRSIRHGWEQYLIAILRDVLHRTVIMTGEARIKAVIFDLDNTLWRGLASDGQIGIYQARPQGLIEALKILKRRGIYVAIASKNDESYIREHWDEILGEWSPVPLGCKLSLDDFDVVKIDFRPKSVSIAEILGELNILPSSAVFVDDNPLEREEVQSAFADIRVLGSELNYARRELLHSPFTQADIRTAEDAVRSATVRTQAELQTHLHAGSAAGFLQSLNLVCRVDEVTDSDSPAARRAEQLINKTNQWSLNGARLAQGELSRALADDSRLFVADVRDAANSYGVVGAGLIDATGRITHLVISCRVIGMGIDEAFMHEVLSACGPLRLAYRDSGKNRAARAFAARRADAPLTDGDVALAELAAPAHVRIEALVASGEM